jgi:hypothetical protein
VVGQGSAMFRSGAGFEVHVGSSLLVGYADVEGRPGMQASLGADAEDSAAAHSIAHPLPSA